SRPASFLGLSGTRPSDSSKAISKLSLPAGNRATNASWAAPATAASTDASTRVDRSFGQIGLLTRLNGIDRIVNRNVKHGEDTAFRERINFVGDRSIRGHLTPSYDFMQKRCLGNLLRRRLSRPMWRCSELAS